MKDRGFTLVELLAIVILLGTLAIIIFPNIMSLYENKTKDINKATLDIIYSSVDQYVKKYPDIYSGNIGTTYCVEIRKIYEENLIPIDVTDYLDRKVEIKIGKTNSYEMKECKIN